MNEYAIIDGTFCEIDYELIHYGVPGMKWGRRKAQITASDRKWARAKYQPSSARSSALAGLYAATGNERVGKALDKSNDRDAKRWAEAKQKVSAAKKATKINAANTKKLMNKKISDLNASEFKDRRKMLEKLLDPTKEHQNDTFNEKPGNRQPFDEKPGKNNKTGRI